MHILETPQWNLKHRRLKKKKKTKTSPYYAPKFISQRLSMNLNKITQHQIQITTFLDIHNYLLIHLFCWINGIDVNCLLYFPSLPVLFMVKKYHLFQVNLVSLIFCDMITVPSCSISLVLASSIHKSAVDFPLCTKHHTPHKVLNTPRLCIPASCSFLLICTNLHK